MPRVAVSAANALVTAPLPPQPVLQALLERLREGLLLFTEDGQVALANPAAQNLLASGEGGGLLLNCGISASGRGQGGDHEDAFAGKDLFQGAGVPGEGF